jgi:hypothetical protein
MHLLDPATIRVVAGLIAEILFCVILLQRGVQRRLPVLVTYAVSLVVLGMLRTAVLWHYGLRSNAYFVVYWGSQALLVALRGAIVGGLCFDILGSYRGLWKFCRDILFGFAVVLLVVAFIVSRQEIDPLDFFVVSVERGLEFAIAGLLVSSFLFYRFYRISVEKFVGRIALGLCGYSLVMVVSTTSSLIPLFDVPIWREVRYAGFFTMLLLWIGALWKPIPARQAIPALLGAEQYDAVSFGVIGRLRELNARLEEMLR